MHVRGARGAGWASRGDKTLILQMRNLMHKGYCFASSWASVSPSEGEDVDGTSSSSAWACTGRRHWHSGPPWAGRRHDAEQGPEPGSSASTPFLGDMAAILAGSEPPGTSEEEPPAQLSKSPSGGLRYTSTTKAMPCGALLLSQGPFFTAQSLCLHPDLLSIPPSYEPPSSPAHTPAHSHVLSRALGAALTRPWQCFCASPFFLLCPLPPAPQPC